MPMPTKFDGEKSIIALMANELIKYIVVVVVVVVVDKSGIRTYKTLIIIIIITIIIVGVKNTQKENNDECTLIGKVFDGCIRDLGFNSRLHQKLISVLV